MEGYVFMRNRNKKLHPSDIGVILLGSLELFRDLKMVTRTTLESLCVE